ncbi:MAG: hypothetical protein ACXWPI_01210, partial [Ktedonobacterales bacterium]
MDYLVPYAAGFFDGEGYLSIRRHTRDNMRGLMLTITNIDPRPLNIIKERWGGSVFIIRREAPQRDVHRLTMGTATAFRFISEIKPYIIVKQEQIEVALRFQQSIEEWRDYKHAKGHKGTR